MVLEKSSLLVEEVLKLLSIATRFVSSATTLEVLVDIS